jgi:hypothetical protein
MAIWIREKIREFIELLTSMKVIGFRGESGQTVIPSGNPLEEVDGKQCAFRTDGRERDALAKLHVTFLF